MAAELDAKARQGSSVPARIEWEIIARSYRRLALLADQNALADIYYEPPLERPVLQQQQIQPKPESE